MRGPAVLLMLAAQAIPAMACSCIPTTPDDIIRRSDAVVEGRVAVVTAVGTQVQATIEVSRVQTGPPLEAVVVLTPSSGAACGVPFRLNDRVRVALKRDGRVWRTDLCMALGLAPGRSPQR